MNRQEVFDTVAAHLLTQRKKSIRGVTQTCAYRGDNGEKCAIGCLIPDDKYDKKMEGLSAYMSPVLDLLCVSLNCTIDSSHIGGDHTFLRQLQVIHDVDAVECWKQALIFLAEKYNLDSKIVDKFQ